MSLRKLLCSIALLSTSAFAQTAATPPMGWNSWNHFAGHVTDADVRSAADQMVSTGMRDAGYVYVNVDDTWQGKRDAQGVLHANERFPDMKALGDYIHSKGLKFGIYSSPGAQTCGHYEGSLGHEKQDADMYAAWGVDFLKYDLCSMQDDMRAYKAAHPEDPGGEYRMMIAAFKKMADALKATGRPIFYSLCQYGMERPWVFGREIGAQSWRTTDDIYDKYDRMMLIGQSQAAIAKFNGPGHWNDPDMLEIGNGGMTLEEYRSHMSLWVLLSAPLLAGNDLSKMTDADKSLLMNKEAIAIDQDAMGAAAERAAQEGDFSIWVKPLAGGRHAIGVFNSAGDRRDYAMDLAKIGFPKGATLRDVWSGKDMGHVSGLLNQTIPTHGVLLYITSN